MKRSQIIGSSYKVDYDAIEHANTLKYAGIAIGQHDYNEGCSTLDKAIWLYKDLSRKHPLDKLYFQYNVGYCLMRQNKLDEAGNLYFDELLPLSNRKDHSIYKSAICIQLCNIHRLKGQYSLSYSYSLKALEINPGYQLAWINLLYNAAIMDHTMMMEVAKRKVKEYGILSDALKLAPRAEKDYIINSITH